MSNFNQGAPGVATLINSSAVLVTGNAASANALTVRQFGTGNVFSAQTTTGSTALFVSGSGNVGVGTTNIGALFQVNASSVAPTIPTVHIGDNSNDFGAGYGMVHLTRSGTPGDTKAHLTLIRNGNTGVNFGFYNNTNTFGIWPSLGNTGTTPTISITSNGLVGIGTTNPESSLHVSGFGATASTDYSAILTLHNTNPSYARGRARIQADHDGAVGAGNKLTFWTRLDSGTNFDGTQLIYERMCIKNNGNVGIGVTNPGAQFSVQNNQNIVGAVQLANFLNYAGSGILALYDPGNANMGTGWNGASACAYLARNNTSTRSMNAAGSLNASGADYAEYMTKAGDFTIKKGDIIGVNSQGLLTNVFADSVTFTVKSTDPSYVGGDVWGTEEALGVAKPKEVKEDDPGYTEYQTNLVIFNTTLEQARARVDRIAFAGQVPVNVLGATPGQYIVPVANEDGSISGQAVSSPTMEQYMAAVGKVIKVLPDGRAQIIVKVV